jgi:hypothetical protein
MVFHVEEEKTRSKRCGKIKYIPKPKVEIDKICHPDECHRNGSNENLNTKSDHKSGQEKRRSSKSRSKAKKRSTRADFSSFKYPSNPVEEAGSRIDSANRPNSSKHSKALQGNVTKHIALCGQFKDFGSPRFHDSSYSTFDITEVESDLSDSEVSMTIDDIANTVGSKSELKNHSSHTGPSMYSSDLSMTIDDIANTVGSKNELKNHPSHTGPSMYSSDLSMTIDDIANAVGSKSELKNHSSYSGPPKKSDYKLGQEKQRSSKSHSKARRRAPRADFSSFNYPTNPVEEAGSKNNSTNRPNSSKHSKALQGNVTKHIALCGQFKEIGSPRFHDSSYTTFDITEVSSDLSDGEVSMTIDDIANTVGSKNELKNHSSYSGPFIYPKPLKGDRLYACTKSNIMKGKNAHFHSSMPSRKEAVRYPCNSMSFDFAKDSSKLSDNKDSMSVDIVANNNLKADLKNHSSYSGPFRYPKPLKADREEPSSTTKPRRKMKTLGAT